MVLRQHSLCLFPFTHYTSREYVTYSHELCICADSPHKNVTLRTDAIDKQAMTADISAIDGDILLGIIDKIETQIKVAPAAGGGCTCTHTSKYHTKGDAVVPQENLKIADEQSTKLFKAVEAYLLDN